MRSRFAPSPSGRMHLGNAWAALACWLACRSAGGTMLLRIEDIDQARSRQEFIELIPKDLAWLGLTWDEGPVKGGVFGPYVQSERLARYDEVLTELAEQKVIYPCYCTRKELQEAARIRRNAGPVYPGFCRNLTPEQCLERENSGRHPSLRVSFPPGKVTFDDLVLGPITLHTSELGGDFPVRRTDGIHAYQLAVAVDDADMQVTQVIRGADILDSTPRQLRLFELLGATPPDYGHVPLLVDNTGRKLSKSHKDLELAALRERGGRPEVVIGYLAFKSGLIDRYRPMQAGELLPGFSLTRLNRPPIVVEPDTEAELIRLSGER